MKAGKTAGTAGFALKVLNGVFEDARRKAVILSNPVQAVKPLASATSEERRPFTDAQVKALLSVADTEWQGMILFAYHTGIRLNDAANLSRQNIEGGKLLRFREAKTAHRKQRATERETVVVMASDLRDYLKSLTIPMKKDAPLFPSLYGKKSGSAGGLSNAFARLLEKAGIDRELGEARKGKGRRFSALSFVESAASDCASASYVSRDAVTSHEGHERAFHR
ncbi:MAG: hypothetical protein B7Z37_28495 [Verrucomicrobia bacterium 12-59-8]|nr:MAG: hypothetical protein B7Z37_28495 [Verrucomicrobia bacterium 12-59-8]